MPAGGKLRIRYPAMGGLTGRVLMHCHVGVHSGSAEGQGHGNPVRRHIQGEPGDPEKRVRGLFSLFIRSLLAVR